MMLLSGCALQATSIDDVFMRIAPPVLEFGQEAAPKLDLGGVWQYTRKPADNFWETLDVKSEKWQDYQVPGTIDMQGLAAPFADPAAAYRTFTVPGKWDGERLFLRANAINGEADVWINGQLAGVHPGGFTPFELDVTDLVKYGEENTIVVRITYRCLSNDLACAGYAKHIIAGINRDIYLYPAPDLNMLSFHAETDLDAQYEDAVLKAVVKVVNSSDKAIPGGQLNFALAEKDGPSVTLPKASVQLPTIAAGTVYSAEYEFPVDAPNQWSSDYPNLYTFAVELTAEDQEPVRYARQIGFREIEIRGTVLYVNNQPIKIAGANRHECDPLRGRSILKELAWEDAKQFRDANFNFIRTSHYPPSEEFIEACSELGIFVCEEAPFCFTSLMRKVKELKLNKRELNLPPLEELQGDPLVAQAMDKDSKYPEIPYAPMVLPSLEMIERDRSHPAVLMWSMGNESGEGPEFYESMEQARIADPTRPVTFSFEQKSNFADIKDVHYAPGDVDGQYEKPAYLGEANLNSAAFNRNPQEVASDPGVIEYWTMAVKQTWNRVYASEGTFGHCLWGAIDEKFHMPNKKIGPVGIARWGVIDEWRRPKPEFDIVKKIFAPIQIEQTNLAVPSRGQPLTFEVENRHNFRNLKDVMTQWAFNGEQGSVEIDLEPKQSGTVEIPVGQTPKQGDVLQLKFTDPRGFVINEFSLTVGESTVDLPIFSQQSDAAQVKENAESIFVKQDGAVWTFNKGTGQLDAVRTMDDEIIVGGPHLWMVLLESSDARAERNITRDTFDDVPQESLCQQWVSHGVRVEETGGDVIVHIDGEYDVAKVSYHFKYSSQGVELSYDFESKIEAEPRQIGVLFDLPRSFDTLQWKRKGEWTLYSEDNVSRTEGTTTSFRDPTQWPDEKYRVKPAWPWRLDQTEQGTKDFRGTKRDIYVASLTDAAGEGLAFISPDAEHSTRAHVDGDVVKFMCTSYNRPGSFEHRMSFFKRLELKPGDTMQGTAMIKPLTK